MISAGDDDVKMGMLDIRTKFANKCARGLDGDMPSPPTSLSARKQSWSKPALPIPPTTRPSCGNGLPKFPDTQTCCKQPEHGLPCYLFRCQHSVVRIRTLIQRYAPSQVPLRQGGLPTFSLARSILFQRHAALLVTNNALCLMSGLSSDI